MEKRERNQEKGRRWDVIHTLNTERYCLDETFLLCHLTAIYS